MIDAVARLTEFAVKTRYLGAGEPVTEEEHAAAVALAARVLAWADSRVM